MQGTEPKRRCIRGPWRVESLWKALWGRGPRRWRWPMMGRAKGVGGRRGFGLVLAKMKRIVMVESSHMRKRIV